MLDICLQIISPCVMQHVWIGTWLSEFIWMFLLCIVLSVRMSSSWRHDILVLGHGTGQENVMWRSLKLWLMKLALSPFFTGNQPEAFLPQQSRPGQASDQGLPLLILLRPLHISYPLFVTWPSVFSFSLPPLSFYHVSSVEKCLSWLSGLRWCLTVHLSEGQTTFITLSILTFRYFYIIDSALSARQQVILSLAPFKNIQS